MTATIEAIEKFLAPIKVDWRYDGKYILDNEMYLGGGIAGWSRPPEEACYLAIHELSHLVEIDDSRALDPDGWGLKGGTYESTDPFTGRDYYEYRTDAHIQRELRVYAIQSQFSQYFGIPFDIEKAVLVLQRVVWGFEKLPGQSNSEKILWAISKVEELRQQPNYSLAAVIAEFERKKELFRISTQSL
jgi:hypothetical protein